MSFEKINAINQTIKVLSHAIQTLNDAKIVFRNDASFWKSIEEASEQIKNCSKILEDFKTDTIPSRTEGNNELAQD